MGMVVDGCSVSKYSLSCMQGPEECSLSLSNMIVLGQLGRGGTSHVFRAQSMRSKRLFAMKVIDKKANNYRRTALERELTIHGRLNHPSVVRLEGHIEDCDNHYVLTQYCQGGEMTRLLGENLSEQTLAGVLWQVAIGLQYLHGAGVAHCDLKLSNLLLQRGQIKICDFGFSQDITECPSPEKPVCGTIYYMAPEILREKCRKHCRQADVWALGICMLIMLTKKQPYSGESFQQLRRQIIAGQREKLPPVSSELEDLMERLLDMQPKTRITLGEILTHPFITKHTAYLAQPITLRDAPCRQKTISKVERVTQLVSEGEADEPEPVVLQLEQKKEENIKGKQEESEEKPWSFKRNSKKEETPHDNTIERRNNKEQINNDNEKTVKQIKRKEVSASKALPSQPKIESPQPISPIIDARLIRPFQQFHYQTKNDGFIHIAKDGHLSIRVKKTNFEITPDGETLHLNGASIPITQMHAPMYKKPLDLYNYARDVVQLLKEKQYAATWKETHGESELLLAISLDWKRVRAIRTCRGKDTLFEWTKGETWCGIRSQGGNLVRKDIEQLDKEECSAFKIMQGHLCPSQRQQQ